MFFSFDIWNLITHVWLAVLESQSTHGRLMIQYLNCYLICHYIILHFTGFPWSKEWSSRFACSFSSAYSTRLQSTSPRCCMRSNARRDTTSGLIRDSTMTFLDVRPFAPDHAVLLFPVRHSGTVYRILWRIVCRWVFLRQDSRHGYLRKHLDSWNCVLLAVKCMVRASSWWLTTIRGRHWNKYYITLHVLLHVLLCSLFLLEIRVL